MDGERALQIDAIPGPTGASQAFSSMSLRVPRVMEYCGFAGFLRPAIDGS